MVQPMRAALYARVSTEDQVEGYSLDAQKRSFRTLVKGRGWTAHREYREEGKSAHTDDINKRPVFKEAMEDAMAGHNDVLVVHKIDRFSRKLRLALEYFEKLGKAGVGFVSIENQVDYSTPHGKFMLVMQGGLAELYSDNLSQEVKKGLAERKAQGFHLGPMPFGATAGEDGVAIPDPRNYAGLKLTFELAANGKSDADVAQALNTKGYRTVGTRGGQLFAKHSVSGILRNPFYLGYLPDGNRGQLRGKHKPFIDRSLWDAAQEKRKRHRTSTHSSRPKGKRTWSLTGLTRCWQCKGRIHTQYVYRGKPHMGCYNRQKGWGCPQKSANLSVYEEQILGYLHTFSIPEDYQQRILERHRDLEAAYDDAEQERARLDVRLNRLRELYEWGDYTKGEYETRRDETLRQLQSLAPKLQDIAHLDRLARFLDDVPAAWEAATQEQRNTLARTLFDEAWMKDQTVVAVKPQPELEPFFRLNYEEFLKENLEGASSTLLHLPIPIPHRHPGSGSSASCLGANV